MRYLLFAKVTLLIVFQMYGSIILAQTLEGKVTDQNGNAVAYANIGIQGTRYGTISEENGTFSISYREEYADKELLFSAIGYASETVPIETILANSPATIVLKEEEYELGSFEVTADELRTKQIGPRISPLDGNHIIVNEDGGAAKGILIAPDVGNFKITKASIFLDLENRSVFKLRVRFYEDDNGMPGREFTPQNIIIESVAKKERVWVDLDKYNIYYNKPFFLVFEWVYPKSHRRVLLSNLSKERMEQMQKKGTDTLNTEPVSVKFRARNFMRGFKSISRVASQDDWEEDDFMSLMSVEITY